MSLCSLLWPRLGEIVMPAMSAVFEHVCGQRKGRRFGWRGKAVAVDVFWTESEKSPLTGYKTRKVKRVPHLRRSTFQLRSVR